MEYDTFKNMVAESLGLDRTMLTDDASFLYDLGIDSLTLANFIIRVERTFGIKVLLTNVWDIKNVKEAFTLFSHALSAQTIHPQE